MAKNDSSNQSGTPTFKAAPNRPNWWVAVVCFLLGTLILVALYDFNSAQSPIISSERTDGNLVGVVGAYFAGYSFHYFGYAIWLLPILLYRTAWIALRFSKGLTAWRFIAMILALITGAVLGSMCDTFYTLNGEDAQIYIAGPGGLFGKLFYHLDEKRQAAGFIGAPLGTFGSALILGATYLACLIFVFTRDLSAEFEKLRRNLREKWAEHKRIRAEERALRQAAKEAELKRKQEEKTQTDALRAATQAAAKAAQQAAAAKVPDKLPIVTPAPKTKTAAQNDKDGKLTLNIVKAEETKKAANSDLSQRDETNYKFPTIKLLKEYERPSAENAEEEHRANAENLLRILSEFKLTVTLGEIHPGPVITRYEIVPAPGVRGEKIAGLDTNIARGMKAASIRVLPHIPGKSTVGIEVPNRIAAPVGMREIFESEDWVAACARYSIPIALGKDISGKPIIADLSKMPHLLIAGGTGSGKSVCINAIIASILYSKSPNDLRLIMVDPKVIELQVFNELPHMLIPVITEAKKVPGALKWLISEMENRYQYFAKCRGTIRNITGYNNRHKNSPTDQQNLPEITDDETELPDKLPFIVAIIDEFADLMAVAKNEIEGGIARLAAKARAAGIHLILATQRPSVNVITGIIKANLPSRIAFRVASLVDSRTIIDGKGAEALIGKGDMLFTPPGTSSLVRAQGAFVSDEEVNEIVEFLKQNGPPQYAHSVQESIDRAAEEDEDNDDDNDAGDLTDEQLLRKIYNLMRDTGKTSVSFMQRKLGLGYNRTAKLLDTLEDRGYISPDAGNGKRDILKDYPPAGDDE